MRDLHELANYALVKWDDIIAISDAPPDQDWDRWADRFDGDTLTSMMPRHARQPLVIDEWRGVPRGT